MTTKYSPLSPYNPQQPNIANPIFRSFCKPGATLRHTFERARHAGRSGINDLPRHSE
jgi:hypothetical protein